MNSPPHLVTTEEEVRARVMHGFRAGMVCGCFLGALFGDWLLAWARWLLMQL